MIDILGRHDCIYLYALCSITILGLWLSDMVLKEPGNFLNLLFYGHNCYVNLSLLMSSKQVEEIELNTWVSLFFYFINVMWSIQTSLISFLEMLHGYTSTSSGRRLLWLKSAHLLLLATKTLGAELLAIQSDLIRYLISTTWFSFTLRFWVKLEVFFNLGCRLVLGKFDNFLYPYNINKLLSIAWLLCHLKQIKLRNNLVLLPYDLERLWVMIVNPRNIR